MPLPNTVLNANAAANSFLWSGATVLARNAEQNSSPYKCRPKKNNTPNLQISQIWRIFVSNLTPFLLQWHVKIYF